MSANDGFTLGVSPCGSNKCTTLLATADAGRSWRLAGSPPPSLIGEAPAVSKVRFATTRDGWVFGPQLWSTHDGGKTWRQLPQPAQVDDVEAAAGQAYALVGDRLMRTAVHVDAWRAVPGVEHLSGGSTIALHGRTVWLVDAGGPADARLLTSADGATWKTLPDPCATGGDWELSGVAPVDSSQVYLLCAGGAGAGSESKRVLHSTDGGRTGRATASDPPRGGIATGITAASASVVVLAARSGASELYRSGDSGGSWQTPLRQGDGGVGYFDVGFTTATQGVAVYGQPSQSGGAFPELLMTRDAGSTWSVVRF